MRVFVAIDLPKDIRDALSSVQKALRPVTPTARWIAPDSIHVTLKFIGEVPEQRINEIDRAMHSVAWQPFTIIVRGVGFFPSAKSPRIFWAGMEAPSIVEFATEIDAALGKLGFRREERAFHAHMTLARAKDNRIDASLIGAASRFENHEFGSFRADRFFLFQSTLKPEGAIYTRLKEYTLGRP